MRVGEQTLRWTAVAVGMIVLAACGIDLVSAGQPVKPLIQVG